MKRRHEHDDTVAFAIVCLVLGMTGNGTVLAQREAAQAGLTYESLGELPDWSGWWEPQASDPVVPPMRPDDLARYQEARANPEGDPDPLRFCRPLEFVGFNNRFADSIEFLYTPGRVTITSEAGRFRRIYTDGRRLTEHLNGTKMGTSIGHWEGQTLVVETTGIDPNNRYPGWDPGALPIGPNARVTERMTLIDASTLEIDVEIVAPDILTEPDRRKLIYGRSGKTMPQEVVNCVENDRAFDSATGNQRFDLTPPLDLPPPPAQ